MSLSRSIAAFLIGLCCWFPPASPAESLRSTLKALAQQEGFRIEGADQLGRERAAAAEGELPERLEALLKDYNYLLTYGTGGRIATVRITSPKRPGPKPTDRAYVQTTRIGGHHQIAAELTGPNGDRVPVELMVDTGASMVVLPESMMQPLGFHAANLGSGTSQTASDTIAVKVGMLDEVRVGGVTAREVHVSFIPDDKLKGTKLLGMSFLNHFKFSLDDDANELILLSK
jgi:clan AA aspartic protease (TIGR02281 family)